MRRSWLLVGMLISTLCACNGDTIPIDPREEAPLGDKLAIDEELSLEGLEGPVDAVRDEWGRTHIYATSLPDALLVQGYLVARDRHVQLDLFRRFASGRLTEVFGSLDPALIEVDITFRTIGLHRTAQAIYDQSPEHIREAVDAYASGVSQLYAEIRNGDRPLAEGILQYEPEHLTEWTGVDSILMGRFQSWNLSYGLDTGNTALLEDLRTTFSADATEPELAARAGIERDYVRFAPPAPAPVIDGLDEIGEPRALKDPAAWQSGLQTPPAHPHLPALLATTTGFDRAVSRARDVLARHGDFGSNNWALGGLRTASGRAMLASDPHLSLTAPSVFWPVSLHVEHRGPGPKPKDKHIGGIAFAGIPGVILGHNASVAWGATVATFDVTDVYAETLNEDGDAVIFEGTEVPLETIEEVIVDHEGKELVYEVQIVPHHGPIIPHVEDGKVIAPDPEVGAMSVRWTGDAPSFEFEAILGLGDAETVDEARMALERFDVGAQNWMLADTFGDILWTSHAQIPYRDDRALSWNPDTYEGHMPCFVLPGDGTAEWTGFWADDAVPWAKNPHAGYLATANGDQVGGTHDNDPTNDVQPDGSSAYLTCAPAFGFRQARVQELIEGQPGPVTLDDMSAMQADHRSALGLRLVPALLLAIDSARQHEAGAIDRPDLEMVTRDAAYDRDLIAEVETLLEAWRDESDYRAESGIDLDTNEPLPLEDPNARASQATLLFNVFVVRFMARVFGDELARTGRADGTGQYTPALLHLLTSEPQSLATYDATTGDSILWDDLDTPEVESRQERMIRALLDALSWLTDNAGDMEDWRWGRYHRVRFSVPNGIPWDLAIPRGVDEVFADGFPRHGDMFNVDASNFDVTKGVESAPNFYYFSGPTQRFVIELDPNGLKVRNALPGGAVWDRSSPHYADEAEYWRKNETHEIPFYLDDVLAKAESRTLAVPPLQ